MMTSNVPSYEELQEETSEAMDAVVEALPAGTRVDDLTDETPFECAEGRAYFTGHWAAYPDPGIDVQAFVQGLPAQLAHRFEEQSSDLDLSFAHVTLRSTEEADVQVTVSENRVDGVGVVDILGISRCGGMPEGYPP